MNICLNFFSTRPIINLPHIVVNSLDLNSLCHIISLIITIFNWNSKYYPTFWCEIIFFSANFPLIFKMKLQWGLQSFIILWCEQIIGTGSSPFHPPLLPLASSKKCCKETALNIIMVLLHLQKTRWRIIFILFLCKKWVS